MPVALQHMPAIPAAVAGAVNKQGFGQGGGLKLFGDTMSKKFKWPQGSHPPTLSPLGGGGRQTRQEDFLSLLVPISVL